MALPNRIELCCGADRYLRAGLWLLWFAALASVIFHAYRTPLWLLPLSITLLWWSLPSRAFSRLACGQLVLFANGNALLGAEQGTWLASNWRSRWCTVIRFQGARRRHFVWVCASLNTADDYRRLGIWCQFPPHQSAFNVNDSHYHKT